MLALTAKRQNKNDWEEKNSFVLHIGGKTDNVARPRMMWFTSIVINIVRPSRRCRNPFRDLFTWYYVDLNNDSYLFGRKHSLTPFPKSQWAAIWCESVSDVMSYILTQRLFTLFPFRCFKFDASGKESGCFVSTATNVDSLWHHCNFYRCVEKYYCTAFWCTWGWKKFSKNLKILFTDKFRFQNN